ncbi:hypothetical protein SORBI_3005G171100 [Sorghum bicolor]|uniref:Uncharacterized protein n=1 Tax=Sorghum bicolor TaxID=4558 RepID=A0A1B6PT25_SORBI|nr:hypothetical protein SORBI_3005G171100 [Sorghum bicolor]
MVKPRTRKPHRSRVAWTSSSSSTPSQLGYTPLRPVVRKQHDSVLQVRQPAADALHVVALHHQPPHRGALRVVAHGAALAPPVHDPWRRCIPRRRCGQWRRRERVHGRERRCKRSEEEPTPSTKSWTTSSQPTTP